MTSSTESHTWDFSPVFDLLSSLKQQDVATSAHLEDYHAKLTGKTRAGNGSFENDTNGRTGNGQALGDFSKLWNYLGVEPITPTASVPPFEASTAAKKLDLDVYASDGAIYYPPSAKNVQWRDEVEYGADLADTQPDSPPSQDLTKTQRKKRNRRARKKLSNATIDEMPTQTLLSRQAASDADEEDTEEPPLPPAQQAGLHDNVRKTNWISGKDHWTAEARKNPAIDSAASKSKKGHGRDISLSESATGNGGIKDKQTNSLRPGHITPRKAAAEGSVSKGSAAAPAGPDFFRATIEPPKTPARTDANKTIHDSLRKPWPTANPFAALQEIPAPTTPQTMPSKKIIPVIPPAPPAGPSAQFQHDIRPLSLHTSIDRNWSLLLKLMHDFPADRSSLLSPLQLTYNKPQPTGIHVFVDASNILIGYHDHLKRVRGISRFARIPRVYPSFHALALLLERRRPVAKRILVGSTPEVDAFEEARQVGYETCVLDKVYKARELTERQRRFAMRDAGISSSGGGGNASGSDSGDASGALPPQKAKWVEQAVDEVIHLKMLESLVDTPVPAPAAVSSPAPAPAAPSPSIRKMLPRTAKSQPPSTLELRTSPPQPADTTQRPTMILATGDAAEAEYSSGFMRMVQRALDRGWNVEVAAWGASISVAYRTLEKRSKWAGRFRVIELDSYSEELFPKSA